MTFLQNGAELDIEMVRSERGVSDGGRGDGRGRTAVWLTRGYGHDFGLRVPVVTDVVGHFRAVAVHGRGRGRATVVDAAVVLRVVVVVVAVAGMTAMATAALRVSGVGAGHGRAGVTDQRTRQIADAAASAAAAAGRAAVIVTLRVPRIVATANRSYGRLVKRFQFGGHAVVDNVEAHGRQSHTGQYVHGTEPHGHRAGERHFHRPRVAVSDRAQQHETKEYAVQICPAARVQFVQDGRTATNVRRHEREPDHQQRHETRAVRRGCHSRQLGRSRRGRR